MLIMVRCQAADSESNMTKSMSTNPNHVTVDRNDKRELEMSNSVKVTLASCSDLLNRLSAGEGYSTVLPTCSNHLIGKMLPLINCFIHQKAGLGRNNIPC